MTRQVLLIHGGDTFPSYHAYFDNLKNTELSLGWHLLPKKSWKSWLADQLAGSAEYQLLSPQFPNSSNAQYAEWKIYLDKIWPFLRNDCIIIGHSLGGSLLLKYFADLEKQAPAKTGPGANSLKIDKLVFVASPAGHDVDSFDTRPPKHLLEYADHVHFMHSQDDLVVPYSDFEKFQELYEKAHFHAFKDKFHFIDETFPELLDIIKK